MNQPPFPLKPIKCASIVTDDNCLFAKEYEDIYFQAGIGLEEKKHVFLKGNHLPEKWHDKKNFTIAETGFGAGLNFLATLEAWQKHSTKKQHLHYISCELHPLNKTQLRQAHKNFPHIKELSKQLLAHYPGQLIYGFHQLHFANLTLTLIFADAVAAFSQLNATVDAWYLDGFAPSKNPQLWDLKLFKTIANLSKVGSSIATYTVARQVRDNLEACGFAIEKVAGFGKKREMLTARLVKCDKILKKQPWAQTFKAKFHSRKPRIAIIGAGIAGLSLAHKLQKHELDVCLVERQKKPCMEASGNAQAVVMPALDLNGSIEAQFHLSAFLYAIKYYSADFFHACGVYQLALDAKQEQWQDKLLQRLALPKSIVKKYQQGVLYPRAGWLDTQGHAQLMQADSTQFFQAEVSSIKFCDEKWQLFQGESALLEADVLVLANGMHCMDLLHDYRLPLVAKSGEISRFNVEGIHNQVSETTHVLLHKGYITPAWQDRQIVGATFEHVSASRLSQALTTTKTHWSKNKNLWQNSTLYDDLQQFHTAKSRVGIRVTTPDHMPVCGALINQQHFQQAYQDLALGKKWKNYPQPQALNNLYIFTGLGSRGFTTAPLLAEFLSNQILGQAQCLPQNIIEKIHPNRFLFRGLKKSIATSH